MSTPPFLRPQGTIVPTLFVGMGGTGSRIVNRIARRASRLPNWDAQLKDLTGFFVLDTNQHDQKQLSAELPPTSRHLIGAIDKRAIVQAFRRAHDPKALQWLDDRYMPREGITPGAGQIRVESRLGFHVSSQEIRQKLDTMIRRLLAPNNTWRSAKTQKIYVYLYCTLAGGTGSGSFLPMAYLIQDLVKAFGWEARVIGSLLLSTTMTQAVKPALHNDIHANCYAALKELEHLTHLQYQKVRAQFPDGMEFVYWNNPHEEELPRVSSGPFFLSFLIDQPKQIAIDRIEHAVADGSFLQLFTPLIDHIASEMDNYEKKLNDLTHASGDFRGLAQGFAKHYGCYGTAVLQLPAPDMVRYCALRFAAGAVRRQLTFNFDSSSRQDLARVLSQFSIDYASDEFRQLDESVRFARINSAFIGAVQELARQDVRAKRPDGYWNRLVEAAQEGARTGQHDDAGNEIRGEAWITKISRLLEAQRTEALRQVSIPEETLIFHRETYQQWTEVVSRLLERVRLSELRLQEHQQQIRTSAAEGEAIADLNLDSMQERYLCLRLFDLVKGKWLPGAESAAAKLQAESASNPRIQRKLRDDDLSALKNAADARTILMRPDEERFRMAFDQVQSDYRKAIRAQLEYFNAQIEEIQFRALLEFLEQRAKLYARLSLRMNALVEDIEAEADSLLRFQEGGANPRLSLSVEVFETLTEPRRRLWPEVFDALFLDNGAEYITFDRQQLSTVVAQQLAPVPGPGGRYQNKTDEQAAYDLKTALIALGETQVRGTFFGNPDNPLDVERGLELEAKIVLGEGASRSDIDEYVDSKFQAVEQMGGVLGRVNLAVGQAAVDEGVVPYRARLLLYERGRYSTSFISRLKTYVQESGLEPNEVVEDKRDYHDPHTILIHDIVAAIPPYYFDPIVRDIEGAYEMAAADDSRMYNLHIEYGWEHSLPNLNPRKSELTIGWSIERLVDGLIASVVQPKGPNGRDFYWCRQPQEDFRLGATFAAMLYSIGLLHRDRELRRQFEQATEQARQALSYEERIRREKAWHAWMEREIGEIRVHQAQGRVTTAEQLDEPILQCLRLMLERTRTESVAAAATTEPNPVPRFD
jgi:hypothetical protein